jgi:hypothetical protein
MGYLSPQTLTLAEQRAILRAAAEKVASPQPRPTGHPHVAICCATHESTPTGRSVPSLRRP